MVSPTYISEEFVVKTWGDPNALDFLFQTLFLRHGKRQVIFNYIWHPELVWICGILSGEMEVEAAGESETKQ